MVTTQKLVHLMRLSLTPAEKQSLRAKALKAMGYKLRKSNSKKSTTAELA